MMCRTLPAPLPPGARPADWADRYQRGCPGGLRGEKGDTPVGPTADPSMPSAGQQAERERSVVVNTSRGPRRILLGHICYVERVGRFMRYYGTDFTVDSLSIRTAFKKAAAPLLADPRFFLCGASFAFNFQHVIGIEDKAALLDNGARVPLPRTAVGAFRRAWNHYWAGEMPAQ